MVNKLRKYKKLPGAYGSLGRAVNLFLADYQTITLTPADLQKYTTCPPTNTLLQAFLASPVPLTKFNCNELEEAYNRFADGRFSNNNSTMELPAG